MKQCLTRFYWVSAGFLRLWSDGAGPIFVTWASFIVVVFVVFCFGFSRFSSGPLRPYGIRSATTERQLVTVSPNGSRPSRRWSHEYIVSFSFRFLCLHFGFISLRFGAPSSSSSSFFLSFCLSFFLSFSFSSPPRRSFIDDRSRRQAAFEQVRAATQLRPTCRYNKKKQKRETKPRTHPYLTHPRRKTDSSLIRRFISGNRSACRAYEAGTETNGEI